MGDEKQKYLQEMGFKECRDVRWSPIKKDEYCESMGSSSINDSFSSSSSELADDDEDASSSSSSAPSNSSSSRGPLCELAELVALRPIKRGLSKFYNGKSKTFAFLSNVTNVEDLAKKRASYRRRMKFCKSQGPRGNLNQQNFGPKPTITKRPPRRLFSTSRLFGQY